MDLRVISIGTLSANPLWGERAAARTGHATTTLIVSGDARILVDPGLPTQALLARLSERTNITASDITHVFLTNFHPDTRRAITAFDGAQWVIHEAEREAVGVPLAARLKRLASDGDDDEQLRDILRQDIAILQRCRPAPERLADRVSLFPLHGVTPGHCGLLIEDLRHTTVICGDAIPTVEHLEQGKILPTAVDVTQAQESFQEIVEIADMLVLGRDNLVINPTKRPF